MTSAIVLLLSPIESLALFERSARWPSSYANNPKIKIHALRQRTITEQQIMDAELSVRLAWPTPEGQMRAQ